MDFNRYKGTLESIRKISASFQDSFNIYELYLDYRNNDWVFLPDLVYKNPELEDSLINKIFKYHEIADNAKHFLISKETADALRLSNNILLPIKTNLVLLDYKGLYQHSELLILYSTIILNHFKDYPIILYLKDGQYKTTFKNFYKSWYYVFFKLFNITYYASNGILISFDFQKEPFPFKLEQLFEIKTDYESIKTVTDVNKFRKKYSEIFTTYVNNEQQTSKDLIVTYSLELPIDLVTYLDSQIVDKLSAETVLDDLYDSLITWMFTLQEKYDTYREFFQIFIGQLPLLNISLSDSVSYLLINHLKPYHTEIILNDNYSSLYIKDKFNSVLNDHFYLFKFLLEKITLSHYSHYIFERLKFNDTSSFPIITSLNNSVFKLLKEHQVTISKLQKVQTKTKNKHSLINISVSNRLKSKDRQYSSFPINSIMMRKSLTKLKYMKIDFKSNKYNFKIKPKLFSPFHIISDYDFNIIKNPITDNVIINSFSVFKNIKPIKKSIFRNYDKFKHKSKIKKYSMTIISDDEKVLMINVGRISNINIRVLQNTKNKVFKIDNEYIDSFLNKLSAINKNNMVIEFNNKNLYSIKYHTLNDLLIDYMSKFVSFYDLAKINSQYADRVSYYTNVNNSSALLINHSFSTS